MVVECNRFEFFQPHVEKKIFWKRFVCNSVVATKSRHFIYNTGEKLFLPMYFGAIRTVQWAAATSNGATVSVSARGVWENLWKICEVATWGATGRMWSAWNVISKTHLTFELQFLDPNLPNPALIPSQTQPDCHKQFNIDTKYSPSFQSHQHLLDQSSIQWKRSLRHMCDTKCLSSNFSNRWYVPTDK